MVIWGLEPGPLVFVDHPDFVWGLIASLYVANLFALLINIGFIPIFIWVLKMPFTILAPIIFVLCIIGGYVPTMSMHDVWLMLIFGVVGYLMRKLDYPMAPAVLAIVLGPLAEPALRQSLIGSQGDVMIFFERPISGTIMAIAIILFALPLIKIRKESAQETKTQCVEPFRCESNHSIHKGQDHNGRCNPPGRGRKPTWRLNTIKLEKALVSSSVPHPLARNTASSRVTCSTLSRLTDL